MRALPLVFLPVAAVVLACAVPQSPAAADLGAPAERTVGTPVAASGAPRTQAIPLYSAEPLARRDLEGLTLRELTLRRNTIYARVGNPFNKKWLRDYFAAQPWYTPLARADLDRLSEADRRNAALVAEVESSIPKDILREKKEELIELRGTMGTAFCCDNAIELDLLSAALGEYAGDPDVPPELRSPLEDPTVLDRKLSDAQIANLSRRDLRIARNTIFARHGRGFQSELLRDWFAQKVWYVIDPTYADSRLTAIDETNLALLQARERALGGPLTDEDHAFENANGMIAA